MGKSSPKPPAAPDPAKTAAAQAETNKETAYWNAVMGNVNQYTPYGSLTWAVNGRPTTGVMGTGGAGSTGGTGAGTGTGSGTGTTGTGGLPAGLPAGATLVPPIGQRGEIYGSPPSGTMYQLGNSRYIVGRDGQIYAGVMPSVINSSSRVNWSPYGGGGTSSATGSGSGTGTGGTSGGGTVGGNGVPSFASLGDTPPVFSSTIKLSPEQQAIYDSSARRDLAMSKLGESQIGRIEQSVAQPYSYSGIPALYGNGDLEQARKDTEEAIYSRLDPQFAKDDEALRTRLINSGIGEGSEAWSNAFNTFNQAKTDARMQAILAGGTEADRLFGQSMASRQQGIQEYNAQRNAPLNEYSAIVSGAQVTNPQFQNYNYSGAAAPDYAGLVNQNYASKVGLYNQGVASANNTQNALFGLGGQALGGFLGSNAGSELISGWLSDINAKENIVRISQTPGGIPVYEFNYKGDDTPQIGVMAQEVEKVIPEAVFEINGLKHVNYAMVR